MSTTNHPVAVKDLLPWALVLLAGTAAAQSPAAPTQPAMPAMPAMPTRLQYTSTLSGYQAYADEPVQSWREANDRVGRIGGWKVYAKEKPPGVAPTAETPAAPLPHGAHHGGGKP
ncbi:hypothetical protein [Sphaerotilus sp.]|uniref:hypothetical protein n=1 Tax=Sphaerotilus sp. TaxID=2093942 RepID=UPI002ACE68F5|nr:hypothetical protein [Sphaerotilus sp.]MDZ7854807.1 hypothetical protein [Sphaerotilus sp.]